MTKGLPLLLTLSIRQALPHLVPSAAAKLVSLSMPECDDWSRY